jgi:hypothetical protein
MIGKINALTNHKIKRTGSIRNVEITKVLWYITVDRFDDMEVRNDSRPAANPSNTP